ncbi:hypothetical protein TRICHSKD4_5338 [Roseibium sp. TrichSKD4]|uniref:hypothetical protein n=1 Tax=Roseibium sp. TrichSKD4 TaxID=744980 RepID=UPI0001E57712|nr:hypothetical protein [Roseibium sp. TrichSKD4]EFO29509.1 hypothetical protein TRICHSKD4_5338 [Roseibium sp. TrichSKD4]
MIISLSPALRRVVPTLVTSILIGISITANADSERRDLLRCEKQICRSVNNSLKTGTLSCPIRKTWKAEELASEAEKIGVSWTYGGATCSVRLLLPRKDLTEALKAKNGTLHFNPHELKCIGDTAPKNHLATLSLAPTVTFENGKATEALFNVSDIDGSYAISGLLWTVAGLNDKTGLLQESLTREINKLLHRTCPKYK